MRICFPTNGAVLPMANVIFHSITNSVQKDLFLTVHRSVPSEILFTKYYNSRIHFKYRCFFRAGQTARIQPWTHLKIQCLDIHQCKRKTPNWFSEGASYKETEKANIIINAFSIVSYCLTLIVSHNADII